MKKLLCALGIISPVLAMGADIPINNDGFESPALAPPPPKAAAADQWIDNWNSSGVHLPDPAQLTPYNGNQVGFTNADAELCQDMGVNYAADTVYTLSAQFAWRSNLAQTQGTVSFRRVSDNSNVAGGVLTASTNATANTWESISVELDAAEVAAAAPAIVGTEIRICLSTPTGESQVDWDDVLLDGTPTAAPNLALDVNPVNFPDTAIGSTSSMTVTMTNNGGAGSILSYDPIPDPSNPVFALDGGASTCDATLGSTLAQGVSCTLVYDFTPTVAQAETGNLIISSDDPDSPETTLVLNGNGVTAGAAVPTLSDWGRWLLAIVLLGLGLNGLRRRLEGGRVL